MRQKSLLQVLLTLLLAVAFVSPAAAEIKLPTIIGDNMVLQREMPVPIWGWAEPKEKISVTFDNQSVATIADKDGKWKITLKELKASADPKGMAIRGDKSEPVDLKNILVGEVWVCSGQSNMEWPMTRTAKSAEEIEAAKYPEIRLFKLPKTQANEPQDNCPGSWSECSPATVKDFSAVGFFFGRHLYKDLGVPIGLIRTAWGGTPAENWTKKEILESHDILKPLVGRGSKLYNAMIHPLIPFAIRGAIWYQGESNCSRAFQYRTLFPAMIKNWRDDWGQGDFPFGFVQLAPFRYGRQDPACCAELWEAQVMTLKGLPNIGMAVTTDITTLRNIHPPNKQDVGLRLGLWAMATVYGKKDLVYSGPIYKSMKVEGDKIRLEFDHTGGGLASSDGKPLIDFTIAGEDQKFEPATAAIDGKTIVVQSDKVNNPVAVRFGWYDTATPNLINKECLPASPFRTDSWKGVTEPKE